MSENVLEANKNNLGHDQKKNLTVDEKGDVLQLVTIFTQNICIKSVICFPTIFSNGPVIPT